MPSKKNRELAGIASRRPLEVSDWDILKQLVINQHMDEIERRSPIRARPNEARPTEMYENGAKAQRPKNERNAGVKPFWLGQLAGCIQLERTRNGRAFLRPVELRRRLDRLREQLNERLSPGLRGSPRIREFETPLKRQTVERWCRKIRVDVSNPSFIEETQSQIDDLKKNYPKIFEDLIK